MPTVGSRLRHERAKIGLSQERLAKLVGVSRATQNEYEVGKTSPNADMLLKLRDHGIDVAYVLTGERHSGSLSEDERQLLSSYRGLHPLCRGSLLVIARHLNSEDTPDTALTILRAGMAGRQSVS